ncbi:L-histidine N(alpha)-methyltransferase [Mesorhizobium captivum]|uniref:L-histidine N(alpha)-methyltransferase n=1 Tax=Mesorhizobium captivum TaxID=3072319 RepID=UPI003D31C974
MNWRFDGNFEVFNFRHVAFHNNSLYRMDSHLDAVKAQSIRLGQLDFSFQLNKGEMI